MRNNRLAALAVAVIAVLLIPLSLAALTAHAASTPSAPKLRFAINGTKIIINNDFYNLELDYSKGGITFLEAKNDLGKSIITVQNTTVPAFSITIPGNNTTILLKNGILDTKYVSNNTIIITIKYNYNNETITQLYEFYSYSPFIYTQIYYTGNLTLTINLPAIYPNNTQMLTLYSSYKENKLTLEKIEGNGIALLKGLPLGFLEAEISSAKNSTSLEYVVAVKPSGATPVLLNLTVENKTGAMLEKDLGLTYVIPGGGPHTVGLEAAYSNYLPLVVATPPFGTIISNITNINNTLLLVTSINKFINQTKREIKNLNDQINNLLDKNRQLQKQLDTCKGQIDFLKQEIKAAQDQAAVIKIRLQHTGMKEAAFFVIGVILGLIGGLYAVNIKR
ncbi:MAG: hypothetical protein LRS48_02265 [Desulfurococcales archaeon]|nr:hypothetical protein [Desulfurococcales archaeon]